MDCCCAVAKLLASGRTTGCLTKAKPEPSTRCSHSSTQQAAGSRQQAASSKQRAASSKQRAARSTQHAASYTQRATSSKQQAAGSLAPSDCAANAPREPTGPPWKCRTMACSPDPAECETCVGDPPDLVSGSLHISRARDKLPSAICSWHCYAYCRSLLKSIAGRHLAILACQRADCVMQCTQR